MRTGIILCLIGGICAAGFNLSYHVADNIGYIGKISQRKIDAINKKLLESTKETDKLRSNIQTVSQESIEMKEAGVEMQEAISGLLKESIKDKTKYANLK